MVDINKVCSDLEQCVGKNTYGTPQTINISKLKNGGYKIECAGLLKAAIDGNGGNLYNGSNTIWREYLTDSGYITDSKPSEDYPHKTNGLSSKKLEKGMAVFKWVRYGCSKAKHEADGKGNYKHIGMVTSTSPLRIVHASSETQGKPCVVVDTKIGKWAAWGKIKGLNYSSKTQTEQVVGTVAGGTLRTTTTLNIRSGAGTNKSIIGTIKKNTVVSFVGDPDDTWVQIVHGDTVGYICTNQNNRTYVEILSTYGNDEKVEEGDNANTPDFDLIGELREAVSTLNNILSKLENS